MTILRTMPCESWKPFLSPSDAVDATQALEEGQVLFFPQLPFILLASENPFLSPAYVHPQSKNVSLNTEGSLRSASCSVEEQSALKAMLQRFSESAAALVTSLFPGYVSALKKGRTSFRPVEVAGRISSYRKDDTRLHVDAFPATPNQGQRILRVFTNINPAGCARHWRLGESFFAVVKKFLPKTKRQWLGKAALLALFKITKSKRTEYDNRMLQLHDLMKADLAYQASVQYADVYFPAQTTWVVCTDQVSHAAMSGQYMLEQTFYLPVEAMQDPSRSPLRVLEKSLGQHLV